MQSYKVFVVTCHCVCLLAAFGMLLYGTVRFMEDESTSLIDFQTFNKRPEDIYPTISFCFFADDLYTPWYGGNLPLYKANSIKQKYDYVRFLLGNDSKPFTTTQIKEFSEIDYKEVTLDMSDYLKMVKVDSAEGNLYEWREESNLTMPLYISYRHPLCKCYAAELSEETMPRIKGEILDKIQIDFSAKNSIFNASSETDFAVYLHYPKQLMRAKNIYIDHLGKSAEKFRIWFMLENMKIIRRRNTRVSPCVEDYKQDDDLIRRKLIKKAGCRPSHWQIAEYYPVCTNIHKMLQVLTPSLRTIDSKFLKSFDPPCHQIQTIAFTSKDEVPPKGLCSKEGQDQQQGAHGNHSENSTKVMFKGKWSTREHLCRKETKTIDIVFKNPTYEEILHVQAFNIESWIGNVGGYVGLFLGVACWQIPDFMEFVLMKWNLVARKMWNSY